MASATDVTEAHARALHLFEQGQADEAAAALRDGLRGAIDPVALNDLAVLENGNGNADAARDLLQAVVRLYPEYEAAVVNLAELGGRPQRSAPRRAHAAETGTAGMAYYPKCWDGDFTVCPADRDIATYIDLYEPAHGGLKIFHFGTGGHHHVGMSNHRREHPNIVFGITASSDEYQGYIDLCLEDGSLGRDYHVYFGDIYNLREQYLPELDIASMPHIGEYYDLTVGREPGITADVENTDRSRYAGLDDRSLLELIVNKLAVGGRLLIYTRSNGTALTQELLHELVTIQGRLRYCRMHETIAVFTKIS
jgi:hypothetical protein